MTDEPRPRRTRGDVESVLAMPGLGGKAVDHLHELGATLSITRTRTVVVRHMARGATRISCAGSFDALSDVKLAVPTDGNRRAILGVLPFPRQAAVVLFDSTEWSAAERVVHRLCARVTQGWRPQRSE